ncbi:LuxR C-terminal-related transcriptional regulator [Azospirillum sp. A26]|uniref:LuxR C-terminal-related transcriptional regulator n=1 Tax=Azospirillum sp. A26 TaxID=3160607 RepID=UPI00366E00B1
MLDPNTRVQNATRRLAALSPRELDVARLVCCGDASKVIAFKLGIAQKTVEVHRERIMDKTECGSLVEFGRLWEAGLAEREDAAPAPMPARRNAEIREVAYA